MKKISIMILGILMIGACSKKEPEIKPQELNGTYSVIYPDNLKYAEIGDDFLSFYGGTFGSYGTRVKPNTYPLEKKINTVLYKEEDFTISWNGQTLTLEGAKNKYILIKTSDIPKASEWIKSAQAEKLFDQDKYVQGNSIQDLTLYGGHVITSGYMNKAGNYVLGKIDPKNPTIEELSIPAGSRTSLGYSNNIEYMGGSLFWIYERGSVSDKMFAFDVDTRELKNTTAMNGDKGLVVYQMAANSDKNVLWGTFFDGIKKYDFINQKWGYPIDLGTQMVNGIAISGNYLYVATHEYIHKYSLETMRAVDAYSIPSNYKPNGIVFTSPKEIIATAFDHDTRKDVFIKITLP